MPESAKIVPLPDELRRYFWDVRFGDLSVEKYPRFIAERILNYGDMKEVKWLLSWLDRNLLEDVVYNSRNLNAKTRNFWKLVLTDYHKGITCNEH